MASASMMRFADISANLTDERFQGVYDGKKLHEPDLEAVLARSKARGVEKIIVTGTSTQSSLQAIELASKYGYNASAGLYPSIEWPDGNQSDIRRLSQLISSDILKRRNMDPGDSVVEALGPIGLDYTQLNLVPKLPQLQAFPHLLRLAREIYIPLLIRLRGPGSHRDFINVLRAEKWITEDEERRRFGGVPDRRDKKEWGRLGIVIGFAGSQMEMDELISYGLYIGLNGGSLETWENIRAIRAIPLDRLLLGTDSPSCEVSTSSAGADYLPYPDHELAAIPKNPTFTPGRNEGIEGRSEPGDIAALAYAVAQVKGVPVEDVVDAAWRNSMEIFH